MVHQAGKIKDEEEREKFLNWLWILNLIYMVYQYQVKYFS